MSWNSVSTTVNLIIGLTGFFVLVRLLGPTNYGLVAMATVALAIPQAISGGALSQSLIQQKNLDKVAQSTTFWLEMALALFLCLVLITFSGVIARGFEEPVVETLIVSLCPLLLFKAAASVPLAELRRGLRFKAIAYISAGSTVSSIVVGVSLALLDYGYWALIVMQVVQAGSSAVGAFVASRWLPAIRPSWSSLKPLVNFNLHTVVLKVLRAANGSLPRVLVGSVLGATALGLFDVSRRLFKRISGLLMQPLTNVTLPVASKMQTDLDGLRGWHRLSTVVTTALAYPLYIGVAALLPALVPVLIGENWLDAVLPMQLMMLLGIRSATSISNAGILRGLGKPELATYIALLNLLLACALLIPAVFFGISALVGAMVVGSIAAWLVGTYFVDREIGCGIKKQAVIGWESLVSAIFMFVVVTLVHQFLPQTIPGWVLLPLLALLAACSHFFALWVLRRDHANYFGAVAKALIARDRNALKQLIQSGFPQA